VPEDVAQSVDVRFGSVRAELQEDVAVTIVRLKCVVGKLLHGDEPCRPEFLQSVAVVKERRPERHGHGQIVREDPRPELAIVRRRVPRVQSRRLAAFHEKSDALGQGSKQPLKSGSILGESVEAHDQRSGGLRRNHARLMEAIERLSILRAVITGRQRFGRRRARLRREPQADGAARQAHQEIAPCGLRPASAVVGFA
jgi:hypothetical protein